MKIDNVADLIAETLAQAGVKRIFGVVGDSLNGLTDALRKRKAIDWIHVRHEEVAAFAAAGEAQITGELAVCAGSCGPGNLHLINGLFDAHRSRTPVLAIAAQIPSAEIGGGYFQETHPQDLFRECSHYCELVSDPAQIALRAGKRHSRGRGAARRRRHRHPRRRRVASMRPSAASRRMPGCCRPRRSSSRPKANWRRWPNSSTAPSASRCSAAAAVPAPMTA